MKVKRIIVVKDSDNKKHVFEFQNNLDMTIVAAMLNNVEPSHPRWKELNSVIYNTFMRADDLVDIFHIADFWCDMFDESSYVSEIYFDDYGKRLEDTRNMSSNELLGLYLNYRGI